MAAYQWRGRNSIWNFNLCYDAARASPIFLDRVRARLFFACIVSFSSSFLVLFLEMAGKLEDEEEEEGRHG